MSMASMGSMGMMFPQQGALNNPLITGLQARPQKRSSGASNYKKQEKRPRSTSSEHYPNGCTTYWQIPEDDKMKLAELFEPESLNRMYVGIPQDEHHDLQDAKHPSCK